MKRPRSSHLWLIWFGAVSVVLGTSLVLLIIARPYGIGLILFFVSAESAIAYWHFKLGISVSLATAFGVICGQLDLANWFWLADQIDRLVQHGKHRAERMNDAMHGALNRHAERTPYVVIFLLAAFPSTTLVGVAVSKTHHLPTIPAFLVMSAGNILKIVVCGFAFAHSISLLNWIIE